MARFGLLTTLLSTIVTLLAVEAAPYNTTLGRNADGLSPIARDILLSSRAVIPSSPVWVAYFDRFISSTSLPAVSDLSGFNVFALSFIYSASLQDNAATWAQIDSGTRASIKSQYAAAGISLIVSAYGAGPNPTSAGDDPTAAANFISNYVKTYGLDGVDVDYEDFGAIETAGTAVAWLSTFTRALRAQLPQGQYILTHAPVAPWFTPGIWPGNGYLGVHAAVGSMIDWYNIQFYNQGTSEYTTCAGLLTASSSQWPQSAVFQIAANGVPLNKLVIGKPATTSDATNGYMDPGTLAGCLAQAKNQGWSAGAMTWQYPNGNSAWITQVRSQSFPVSGSSSGGTGGGTGGGGSTGCTSSYTVVSGDTCSAIESRTGVSDATLHSLNPSINSGCTNLAIGQVLCLSGTSSGGSSGGGGSSSGCTSSYTVVSGDTCSAIESRTGVSDATLHSLNPSINSGCTNLAIGQVLCLAGSSSGSTCSSTYTVVSGDTCSALESRFGVSDATLHSLNPSINSGCTNLQIGQVLCI